VRKPIVILGADERQAAELCSVLTREKYRPLSLSSIPEFVAGLLECSPEALIIDFDWVPMDNRTLRELRARTQSLCIIGVSSRTFHPELKESLRLYVDACFSKPLDYDALLYYLRCAIHERPDNNLKADGLDQNEV
jgi:DNA-binding response OmpR family regulator